MAGGAGRRSREPAGGAERIIQDGAGPLTPRRRPSSAAAAAARGVNGAAISTRMPALTEPHVEEAERGSVQQQQENICEEEERVSGPDQGSTTEVSNPVTGRAAISPQTTEPTLKDVFMAVTGCGASLSALQLQMGSLQQEFSFMRHDLQKVNERVVAVEGRVSDVEDQLPSLTRASRTHEQQIASLLAKSDDLENRLRRNNVRILGVPEKMEGQDSTSYFEKWLKDLFGSEVLSPLYAVERAHRVPTRPLPPGAPPRSVLVKLLHYRDRDAILRAARSRPDIAINGRKVAFFPDFSSEVQKKRSQFLDVKKRLRDLHVSYAMLYPARLRVAALGATHFFEVAKEAAKWIDQHEQQLRQEER